MFLREMVGDLFVTHRVALFNMEVGRLAYDLLNKDPDIRITDKVSHMDKMQILVVLKCIAGNVDYTLIIAKNFNHKQMEELRQYLLRGLNVTIIYDTLISHEVMKLVRVTTTKGINMPNINLVDYKLEQVEQIMLGLEQGINIKPLLNNKLSDVEMESIRRRLMNEKIAKTKIATTEYYENIHKHIFGEV